MSLAAVAVVVVLGSSPTAFQRAATTLASVAQASSRPPECAAGQRGRASGSLWDAARYPSLGAYCDRLARAYGLLAASAARAHADAEQADRLWPGHAAPWILKARASARMGDVARALAEFATATSRDAHALDDPATLRDWASVLARSGRTEEALAAFRALGPRLALVYGNEERGAVLIEAGELALAHGPATLDEAIAYLEEARRLHLRTSHGRVLAELALALDRRGDCEDATSVLELLAQQVSPEQAPVGTQDGTTELDAALALLAERSEPAVAAQRWERYLAGASGKGPWGLHARERRDALRRGNPATSGRAAERGSRGQGAQ